MTVTATDARRDFSAEPNTVSTSDPDTTLDDEQEKKKGTGEECCRGGYKMGRREIGERGEKKSFQKLAKVLNFLNIAFRLAS